MSGRWCLARRCMWLVALSGVLALAAGFATFAMLATRVPVYGHGRADAIVVLTGGAARLAEAGRLMRDGYGRRLLISGANAKVSREELARLAGLDAHTAQCCLDLDYARDTIGNAEETRAWAARHRFESLIVVTASYHMPRSLAELAHAMPDVRLIDHPVLPNTLADAAWWRDAGTLRVLAGEYAKLLSSSVRLAMARATAAAEPAHAGEGNRQRITAERP